MALTVPKADELLLHMRRESWDEDMDAEYAKGALQRACDLFTIATEMDTDSTDALVGRVVKVGILSMAHAIFVQAEDKDEVYAPFGSERLGSYSYAKMQQAAASGNATGVTEFDVAVNLVRGGDDNFALSSSEKPFAHGQCEYERELYGSDSIPFPDPSGER